mgnify:FL=1|jgi:hypothetical protein
MASEVILTSELITWRGTPGVGDFMWALNSAHKHVADNNLDKVNLEFHWEHGEDYYHHFEDPETIIERLEYIHNFYHQKEKVMVHHIFNSTGRYTDWKYDDDVVLETNGERRVAAIQRDKARFFFESGAYSDEEGGDIPDNEWLFRKDAFQKTVDNRIVFWRPTWNAEKPRTWKRLFTQSDWDTAIQLLRDKGFECHEISYRTPVSEAMYLISTSRLVLCYDGIWHYIAKNFQRPLAVISSEGVTKYHTPHALRLRTEISYADKSVWWWLEHIEVLLGHTKRKAVNFEKRVRKYYGND